MIEIKNIECNRCYGSYKMKEYSIDGYICNCGNEVNYNDNSNDEYEDYIENLEDLEDEYKEDINEKYNIIYNCINECK
jgi:hypothetical protein